MDTFKLTAEQFDKLEKQLADSHQVVLTMAAGSRTKGTLTTTDGKIAADFEYFPAGEILDVNLTKHDGYMGFIAEAGLKSKLNAAIKTL